MAQLFEEKKTIVSTLYGGTGGHLWDDGLYQGVSKITLFYAKCIKSIAVEYYSNNEIITASTHGGVGNFCVIPNPVTITLGSDEFLKTVSGYVGPVDCIPNATADNLVIRSLKFETNTGKTYGPYGEEEGHQFTFPVKDGDKIIGFFGRSGAHLDAIGFHVETHP